MNAEQLGVVFVAAVGCWAAGFSVGYARAWVRRIVGAA